MRKAQYTETWSSMRDMAEEFGVSYRQIQRVVRELALVPDRAYDGIKLYDAHQSSLVASRLTRHRTGRIGPNTRILKSKQEAKIAAKLK